MSSPWLRQRGYVVNGDCEPVLFVVLTAEFDPEPPFTPSESRPSRLAGSPKGKIPNFAACGCIGSVSHNALFAAARC